MSDYHVKKMAQYMPVARLGVDEQGRQLVACPECGEPATVMEDNSIVCPLGTAIGDYVRQAMDRLLGDPEQETP